MAFAKLTYQQESLTGNASGSAFHARSHCGNTAALLTFIPAALTRTRRDKRGSHHH